MQVTLGSFKFEVCPSPKSQNHCAGEPVEASEKFTLSAAQPLVTDAENAASNCALTLVKLAVNKIKKKYFIKLGGNQKYFGLKKSKMKSCQL